MDFFDSIGDSIYDALVNVWDKFIGYVPNLIAAIIILIVGIILAKFIAKVVQKIVVALKLDALISKINIVQKIEEAGTKVVFSEIISWLVLWFLYVVIFISVAEIMELGRLAEFVNEIALYLPNVIIAVLILVIGLVLGDFSENLLIKLLKTTKARLSALIAAIAKWSILVFAILAALIQLGVATVLIQTLFTAIVVTLALAAGLAFGLGGREAAKEFIEKVRQDIRR